MDILVFIQQTIIILASFFGGMVLEVETGGMARFRGWLIKKLI